MRQTSRELTPGCYPLRLHQMVSLHTQLFRHPVERHRQFAQLIPRSHVYTRIPVARRNPSRPIRQSY